MSLLSVGLAGIKTFVSEQQLQIANKIYRQQNLWGIIHEIYKWSHQNFDFGSALGK